MWVHHGGTIEVVRLKHHGEYIQRRKHVGYPHDGRHALKVKGTIAKRNSRHARKKSNEYNVKAEINYGIKQ